MNQAAMTTTVVVVTPGGERRLAIDGSSHNLFLIRKATMSADDLSDSIQRLLRLAVIYHHREEPAYKAIMNVVDLFSRINQLYTSPDEERVWYVEEPTGSFWEGFSTRVKE